MRFVQLVALLLFGLASSAEIGKGRLLDGEAVAVASHPYSVSLQFEGSHVCGGAIIRANVILTAAHCVTRGGGIESYPPRSFVVRAGSIQRAAGGQLAQVLRVVVHKGYANGLNNLALLVLQTPLTLDAQTQVISLASTVPPAGSEITFSGWGKLKASSALSHQLRQGTMKTISSSECRQLIFIDDEGLLCTVSAKETAISESLMCSGDGGSPAVYNNQLVGIGSFYVGGCGGSTPDGFMNVPHYLDWIQANLP